MWKLIFCIFLSISCLAAEENNCDTTTTPCETTTTKPTDPPTTTCEPPKEQPAPPQNKPPPNNPPKKESPAPPKEKDPPKDQSPPKDQAPAPKNSDGPTEEEQKAICNKSKEPQYKNNPFCPNTGDADDGCKQLSEAGSGSNPKCCRQYVCSFKNKEGEHVYVCSKDMSGVTLYKGCNNDISIISKPNDDSKLSPGPSPGKEDKSGSPDKDNKPNGSPDKDNKPNGSPDKDDKPNGSPPSDTPTDHEQNLICVKAADDLYKSPFCDKSGDADDGCKQLSESVKGSSPSCCHKHVCQFTSPGGAKVYVSSEDVKGAKVYKECHHNVNVIDKPDGGWPKSDSPDKDNKPNGSPPSNTPTDHEQNLICVKAAGDQYKTPFCDQTGNADNGCTGLSDSINGTSPSCCSKYICQFTSPEGAPVYVSSQEIQGATELKGCHHNVRIVSKPAGGWPAPSPPKVTPPVGSQAKEPNVTTPCAPVTSTTPAPCK